MSKQIISYSQNIRELCGIDTVIFTYSKEVATKLRGLLNSDFQIIFHNLKIENTDEMEWLQEALYHSHIFIVTEGSDPFVSGYALSYATEQNPELVIGLNLAEEKLNFLNAITKNSVKSFNSIFDVANYIKDQ